MDRRSRDGRIRDGRLRSLRSWGAWATIVVAALACAACNEGPTEVVVVVNSDLRVSDDADVFIFGAERGTAPPVFPDARGGDILFAFPVTLGFVSDSGSSDVFSIKVELQQTKRAMQGRGAIVLVRSVIGIRFVPGEIRMLFLPLPAACVCQGTSCPNPGDPNCDDLVSPPTAPLDPTMLPPSNVRWAEKTVGNAGQQF